MFRRSAQMCQFVRQHRFGGIGHFDSFASGTERNVDLYSIATAGYSSHYGDVRRGLNTEARRKRAKLSYRTHARLCADILGMNTKK